MNPNDQEATLSTLNGIYDNVIQQSNNDKHRQIKLTDEMFTDAVWKYPGGKEFMKMGGWVVEGDCVRLRDDSCVKIVSQLLKAFSSRSATPLPDDEFQCLIKTFSKKEKHNCLIAYVYIKKSLQVINISHDGFVYSKSGCRFNLLHAATINQNIDLIKLLLTDYSVDPYLPSKAAPLSYIVEIFYYAPQSFIIKILKHCDILIDFKTKQGISLLHCAIILCCFDVVCYFLEKYSDIDVNVTDNLRRTPLHIAYLCGHTHIAEYLIQHGADLNAEDSNGCTPQQYIDSDPGIVKWSHYLQNRRKICEIPDSNEHSYFKELINNGIDDQEAVSLTMEQFPLLNKDGPIQP